MEYKEGKEAQRIFLELETSELIADINNLITKKGKVEKEVSILKEERDALKEEIEKLSLNYNEQSENYECLVSDISSKTIHKENLIKEIDVLDLTIKNLSTRLTEANREVPVVEGELIEAKGQLQFAIAEYNIHKSKTESVKTEYQDKKKYMEEWDERQNNFLPDLERLEALGREVDEKINRNQMLVNMGKEHNTKIVAPLLEHGRD